MSTHDEAPENGNRATVALVDAKVDGIRDLIRAEFKDVGRRLDDLAGLEPRIRALEQTAIGALGPLEEALRQANARVDDLADEVETLTNKTVTAEQVKTALAFDRDQRTRSTDAQFTRREKLIGLTIGIGLAALNVLQAFHIHL